MKAVKIVRDMRTLNAMAKRGLIKLDKATGETVRWNGRSFKAYYIDDYGDNAQWPGAFEYKGNRYTVEYFDGCFCPYVVMKYKKKEYKYEKTNHDTAASF